MKSAYLLKNSEDWLKKSGHLLKRSAHLLKNSEDWLMKSG